MSKTRTNTVAPITQAQLDQHSEQALVELVYVKEANDLITATMGSLGSALNTTQSVLNILQALQNLHNDINVKSPSAFSFNFSTGQISNVRTAVRVSNGVTVFKLTNYPTANNITAYQAAYSKAASAYFGKSLDPFFVFSSQNDPGFASFAANLKSLKNKLRLEISVLTKQTPVASRNDPAGLLGSLRKVFDDLPTSFDFNSVEKWAIDSLSSHGGPAASLAENIQNDLTTAITAAQSLNDTQKEKVRSFLFIFQEYYQSAAAVLSSVDQMMHAITQHISQ